MAKSKSRIIRGVDPKPVVEAPPVDPIALRRARRRELLVSLAIAAVVLVLVAVIRALMPTTEGTVLGIAILVAAWIARSVFIEHFARRDAKEPPSTE